jgi:hypothetical protein
MSVVNTALLMNTKQNNVQSTQEIVELILDSNRNTLLALDLKVLLTLELPPTPLTSTISGVDWHTGHRFRSPGGWSVRHECK